MTYENAKPFVEKLRDLAMFYYAKPNELQRRLYETLDEIENAIKEDEEFQRIERENRMREKLLDEYRSGLDRPPE
jgi:hypothetical protein